MYHYKTKPGEIQTASGALLGIGGLVASSLVLNPIEITKVRLQVQNELVPLNFDNPIYRNMFFGLKKVVQKDGFYGIFKGIGHLFGHQLIVNGLRVGIYSQVVKNMMPAEGIIPSIGHTLAWSATSMVGGIIASPFYLLQVHHQVKSHPYVAVGTQHAYKGPLSAFGEIIAKSGPRGLWHGALSTAPIYGLISGLQFYYFYYFKEFLHYQGLYNIHSSQNTVYSALLTGVVCKLVCGPLDTVSVRYLNQGLDANGKGLIYKNVYDCFKKIVIIEGKNGLYKGSNVMWVRSSAHAFLTIIFYNEMVQSTGLENLNNFLR